MVALAARLLLLLVIATSDFASAADGLQTGNFAQETALPATGRLRSSEGLSASPDQVIELRDPAPRVLTLDLTRDANDIWDRIRRGFGMTDLDTPAVGDQQAFYLNRPGFLKKVFERGGRYLYHIVGELERRGMPTELALLPMVESSYNPMAYSRAHASGLWQFIPSTGRNFNLTQDRWVDERRDVIASTNAALDYLQTIYDMHGDWHLALASYNWGEGAVARAVQRNLNEGLPTDYSSLRMPEETRNYVPKLQALKNIVLRPELFHLELPYVPNTRHFVTVETSGGIDLATAARLAEMPLDEFMALNPGHNRPAIARPENLVIPVDRAEKFQLRLEEHQRTGQRWKTHELQRGETLASVARDYALSLQQLQQLNGLTARSRVSAGYTLLVPEGAGADEALAASRFIPRAAATDLSTIPPEPKLQAGTVTKGNGGAKADRDAARSGKGTKAKGAANERKSAGAGKGGAKSAEKGSNKSATKPAAGKSKPAAKAEGRSPSKAASKPAKHH